MSRFNETEPVWLVWCLNCTKTVIVLEKTIYTMSSSGLMCHCVDSLLRCVTVKQSSKWPLSSQWSGVKAEGFSNSDSDRAPVNCTGWLPWRGAVGLMPSVCNVFGVCTADLARVAHLFGCPLTRLWNIFQQCVRHLPLPSLSQLNRGIWDVVQADGSRRRVAKTLNED